MTYASQIALAERLIKKYGGPAQLNVPTTVDTADKPWATPNMTVDTTDVVAVFLRFGIRYPEQYYKNDEVVHAGDQKVLIAAKGLVLTPNIQGWISRLNAQSATENWKIINCSPLNPNGVEMIMYTLQVRQ